MTLGCRCKFRLLSSLELVLSVSAALTEVVRHELVIFELSTQVGWQTPATFREEIQLIVHMSPPL